MEEDRSSAMQYQVPLSLNVTSSLETPLARKIIAGELAEGSVARVAVENGILSIR